MASKKKLQGPIHLSSRWHMSGQWNAMHQTPETASAWTWDMARRGRVPPGQLRCWQSQWPVNGKVFYYQLKIVNFIPWTISFFFSEKEHRHIIIWSVYCNRLLFEFRLYWQLLCYTSWLFHFVTHNNQLRSVSDRWNCNWHYHTRSTNLCWLSKKKSNLCCAHMLILHATIN